MRAEEFTEMLKERDGFLFLTHARPDGDALGSASALCHAMRRLGKTAYICKNPGTPDRYKPFIESYEEPEGFEPGCVVAMDIADENLFPAGNRHFPEFCIDHHASNSNYAEKSLVMPGKSSCGEVALQVIKLLCGSIDKTEADLLYIAVSTDTGCFCYGNTNAETHEAAAELIRAKASNSVLNKLIFRTFSLERLLLEGMIYANLRSYKDKAVNIAVLSLEMQEKSGVSEDDCEDIASLAGRVAGNRVAVTVRELAPGQCKISVRTDGSLDASALCSLFGGGGHRMAAGCEMALDPDKAAERMLCEIERIWTERA